jgi:predicted phage-related endonuclease
MEQVLHKPVERRSFIGGSDARIIMGTDEAALLRLWREKRGEAEPPDYSGNLLVQLGLATEPLNRRWYERTTGDVIKDVQSWVRRAMRVSGPAARPISTTSVPRWFTSGSCTKPRTALK